MDKCAIPFHDLTITVSIYPSLVITNNDKYNTSYSTIVGANGNWKQLSKIYNFSVVLQPRLGSHSEKKNQTNFKTMASSDFSNRDRLMYLETVSF